MTTYRCMNGDHRPGVANRNLRPTVPVGREGQLLWRSIRVTARCALNRSSSHHVSVLITCEIEVHFPVPIAVVRSAISRRARMSAHFPRENAPYVDFARFGRVCGRHTASAKDFKISAD